MLKRTRAALRTLVLSLLNAGEDPEEVMNAAAEAAVYPSTVLQWNEHAPPDTRLTAEALHRFDLYRNELNHQRIEATSRRDISRATHRVIRTGTRHEANDQRWNVLLDAYREQSREYRSMTGEAYEYGASVRAEEVDGIVDQLRGILADEAAERNPTFDPGELEAVTDESGGEAPGVDGAPELCGPHLSDQQHELPDRFPDDDYYFPDDEDYQ